MSLFILALAIASPPSSALSRMQLNAISATCRTPRGWLQNRNGLTHFRPPTTARYEQIRCVMAALNKLHVGPIGIVGKEVFDPKLK